MKKLIIIITIGIAIIAGFYFGKYMVNTESTISNNVITNSLNTNSDLEENTIENSTVLSSSIVKNGELKTSGLYNYNGDLSYENDLMQNDMIYHTECSLYHKIVTNMNDYNKYKERIAIPEMTENDFTNRVLVIIANETLRKDPKETNLMIYDISCDETTTNIIMKQKETTKDNADQELMNNVFWAIFDKSQLKDNIIVTINKD